jgi:hypothetical protein
MRRRTCAVSRWFSGEPGFKNSVWTRSSWCYVGIMASWYSWDRVAESPPCPCAVRAQYSPIRDNHRISAYHPLSGLHHWLHHERKRTTLTNGDMLPPLTLRPWDMGHSACLIVQRCHLRVRLFGLPVVLMLFSFYEPAVVQGCMVWWYFQMCMTGLRTSP